MIVKVILGTMQNARKLVSIAESIPCDVELCYGRYVVNAKSMLGVLSMPEFDGGELHIHTDNEKECEKILFQLLDQNLLVDTGDAVKRSIYDITTFGEILILLPGILMRTDRCCMPEIRAVHQPMLQLQPADWELILHLSVKQEKTCTESS